jgi:putative peptide zinc metalloprotease protein
MLGFTQKQLGWAAFTFLVYTIFFGWQLALCFVIAVGFHEACHLWAAHKLKLSTKGFYLVPFMGGVAFVADRYKSYGQQAFVVLAGPVGGGLLAIAIAILYWFTGVPILAAAATWMLYLNLFNLLPFSFMDGGQLLDTLTFSINKTLGVFLHILSTIVAVIVLIKFFSPVIGFLVAVFGSSSAIRQFTNWNHYRKGDTYLCDDNFLYPPKRLSVLQWVGTALCWAVTAVVFFIIMVMLKADPHSDFKLLLGH